MPHSSRAGGGESSPRTLIPAGEMAAVLLPSAAVPAVKVPTPPPPTETGRERDGNGTERDRDRDRNGTERAEGSEKFPPPSPEAFPRLSARGGARAPLPPGKSPRSRGFPVRSRSQRSLPPCSNAHGGPGE